jgi:uncharacterized membrane protein YedE/YeeE
MTIGGSILLFVVGAILRYAISWSPDYVDLRLVGLILMIAGAVGLVIALTFLFMRRRGSRPATEVYEERRYSEPPRRYDQPQGRYDQPQGRYDQPQGRYDQPQGRYDEPTRRYGESEVYQERRYSDPPPPY